AAGIALDQQNRLPIAEQRGEAAADRLLIGAAGAHRDDVGALDRRSRVGGDPLDRGKTGILPLDIEAATLADRREAAVVEIVQTQPAAAPTQCGGEIYPADPGADDRDCGVHRASVYVDGGVTGRRRAIGAAGIFETSTRGIGRSIARNTAFPSAL